MKKLKELKELSDFLDRNFPDADNFRVLRNIIATYGGSESGIKAVFIQDRKSVV